MCKLLPIEVVIWKVVLPRAMDVNGTSVEETSPNVCQVQRITIPPENKSINSDLPCKVQKSWMIEPCLKTHECHW